MTLWVIILIVLSKSNHIITDEIDADYQLSDEFEYEVWNIEAKNLFIPYESVTYTSRRLITIPFESKRQISKIKSVIQPENAQYIQSIYLFRCLKSAEPIEESDDYRGNDWFGSRVVTNHNNEVHHCWKLLAVWTDADELNKTILSLPNNMGIPIDGHNEREKYLLFEINYKNSELMEEFADYSGFHVYVRKQNSEIDADIVVVGSAPDYRLFVPPRMKEWIVAGHCYKQCLQNHLFVDSFNVLDVIHYSKSALLKELIVEVKVNDKQSSDEELSMNVLRWTHNQTSDEPIDLKLGETNQISTKCTFSSANETNTVLGGMSESSAQCIAWIVYYPKIEDFDVCLSSFSLTTIMSITGIDHLEEKWRSENQFDIVIKSWTTNKETERLEDWLKKKTDWDYRRANRAKYAALFAPQIPQCSWRRTFFDQVMNNR